ncbi:unnamed protein product, partial [Allacma fusca]
EDSEKEKFLFFPQTVRFIASTSQEQPLINNTRFKERNILDFEAPQELQEAFPYYLSGFDESGAPIWIWQLGRWDIRKWVEIGGEPLKNLEKLGKQMFFRLRESSQNRTEVNDGERTGYISILDMDEYPFRQIAHVQTLKFTLHMIQKLGAALKSHDLKIRYIVNANCIYDLVGIIELFPWRNSRCH